MLELSTTVICHETLKSHKMVFIFWISKKLQNLKAEILFHTRSNLLCNVSVLFMLNIFFTTGAYTHFILMGVSEVSILDAFMNFMNEFV